MGPTYEETKRSAVEGSVFKAINILAGRWHSINPVKRTVGYWLDRVNALKKRVHYISGGRVGNIAN